MSGLNYPCPRCTAIFDNERELFNHALHEHRLDALTQIIREHWSMNQLTKDDFTQIDSQWIFAIGKFHLALIPNKDGTFSLHVYGSIEPIPPATQYPSQPEWERALRSANKFVAAYKIALEQDSGNAIIKDDDPTDTKTSQAPQEQAETDSDEDRSAMD